MADELNDFLSNGPDVASVPPPAPEPEPAAALETPAKPEVEEDDAAVPETGTIPVNVLQAERAKRKDWKEKAIKAETEAAAIKAQMADLKAQLEAASKAPPPAAAAPTPTPAFTPPDPATDPQAYYDFRIFNERLENSEARLRDKLGDEAVDQTIAAFKTAVAANPALAAELRQQRDPYKWAHAHVEKTRALEEIGTDPAAYQARMKEKWLAEYLASQGGDDGGIAPVQGRAAPAVTLPKSLTTARSAAVRNAPTVTGDAPLAELFPGV